MVDGKCIFVIGNFIDAWLCTFPLLFKYIFRYISYAYNLAWTITASWNLAATQEPVFWYAHEMKMSTPDLLLASGLLLPHLTEESAFLPALIPQHKLGWGARSSFEWIRDNPGIRMSVQPAAVAIILSQILILKNPKNWDMASWVPSKNGQVKIPTVWLWVTASEFWPPITGSR